MCALFLFSVYQVSRKVSSWSRPLSKLLPFAVLGAVATHWVYLHPSFFLAHPRVMIFSFGLVFGQMICSLMLAHVCAADYTPVRPVLLPLLFAWLNNVAGPLLLPDLFPLVDPTTSLYALFVANLAIYAHFVLGVIDELTTFLKIRCFHIVPREVGHDGATPAVAAAAEAAKHAFGQASIEGQSMEQEHPDSAHAMQLEDTAMGVATRAKKKASAKIM